MLYFGEKPPPGYEYPIPTSGGGSSVAQEEPKKISDTALKRLRKSAREESAKKEGEKSEE